MMINIFFSSFGATMSKHNVYNERQATRLIQSEMGCIFLDFIDVLRMAKDDFYIMKQQVFKSTCQYWLNKFMLLCVCSKTKDYVKNYIDFEYSLREYATENYTEKPE